MKRDDTHAVEDYLAQREIHDQWERDYRTAANEEHCEEAFDRLVCRVGAAAGAAWLDAGSGACYHSARLARRGFVVEAFDFSPAVVEDARRNVIRWGLQDRVHVTRADLLDLPVPDGAFQRVLCWGVLMHVPEVEKAVAELARVTAPGGWIVVSEVNMRSLQAVTELAMKRLLRRGTPPKRTPAGLEMWTSSGNGTLLARRADISWLTRSFAAHGCEIVERVASQFTEAYTVAPHALRPAINSVNRFWFRHVVRPGPAFGNLLYFRRLS